MAVREMDQILEQIYRAALEAVDPETAVTAYLNSDEFDEKSYRRILPAGIGKAAVPMARAVERKLGSRLSRGMVIVKDGHGGSLERSEVFEASHPEPDERGARAARRMVSWLADELEEEDLLIFLVSGGGSALFPLPVEPLTLQDKQAVTSALIRCGATIQEINAIRKHLSRVKGGRLLDFTNGAQVLSLLLSDVVGDDFASIASGPTSGDPTTFADCFRIIESYDIRNELPKRALEYLEKGSSGGPEAPAETPKPGDSRFERVRNRLIANNYMALERAAQTAARLGFDPLILSSSITGNTADIAAAHVAMAREVLSSGHPLSPPCCLISGGETTVQVRGKGKGGRNMEFALQAAWQMRDWPEHSLLIASLGSDGTDGPTDAAGAVTRPDTVRRARNQGMDASDYLARNDSYNFFKPLDDLIVTGPTRTNVMDLRLVLVGSRVGG